jgi:hypothetical protein
MCASLLEPLQPFLVGATAASVQPPVHDALDAISLRSWLNSPWASSMADELYKAANILRKFNEVRLAGLVAAESCQSLQICIKCLVCCLTNFILLSSARRQTSCASSIRCGWQS